MVFKYPAGKRLLQASAPLILILLVGVVSSVTVYLVQRNNGWVRHTGQVIQQGGKVEKLVIDMETALRGFLLTGKEHFLEPYHQANNQIDNSLRHLTELVSDNPSQQQQALEIKKLIHDWQEQAAIPGIEARRQVSVSQVDANFLQHLLLKKTGKNILDGIRLQLDRIDQTFEKLSDQWGRLLTLRVAKAMVDMETGERGFLVTGDEAFLEPYHHGRDKLDSFLLALRDHAERQNLPMEFLGLIEVLFQETKRWINQAATPEIKARREMNRSQKSIEDILTMVESEMGKQRMDTFRKKMTQFIDVERQLYRTRSRRTERVGEVGLAYTLLSAFLAGLLGFFMLRKTAGR
ncbi:MAG: CHASE3 domain-containing protein [Magnetococcales bacterium]|nr:CHASE3 domain-containing protein [Magnetococcales bacterium]